MPLSCILSLGDNTSAVGWLHKANIDEANNKALQLATTKYATLLMDHQCCLYSSHFKGKFNNVTDALSRQHNLTDSELTSFIFSQFSSQVPPTFEIVPPPQSIVSWTTWLLQKNNEQWESKTAPNQKKREYGTGGKPTYLGSKMSMTPTSATLNPSCAPASSVPSEQPFDEVTFLERIKNPWQEAQLKRPWQNWVRCLGQTWGSTPTMAQTVTHLTPSCPDN
jgi:hypothetical protein